MNWKQFLTEKVLKGCWHDGTSILMAGYHCKKCDKIFTCNRTYSTEADTMELYRQIEKDGKWDVFFWNSASSCKPKRHGLGASETTAWLFCLSGKGYEDRCKMVAEFYDWNEQRDPVIDKNSGAYGDN
jgi:hypothetical protein